MTETVKVIQADRDAAALVYQAFRDHDHARWVLERTNAMGDYDGIIQAFARHRLSATEGMREALEEARKQFEFYAKHHQAEADNAAATIRWREANNKFVEDNADTERLRANRQGKADTNKRLADLCRAALNEGAGE